MFFFCFAINSAVFVFESALCDLVFVTCFLLPV
uniref:Uncharacterized protein n=1 Tax=Anguilla anguilla TaxID=7936 RepID=A0A0E9PT82_ANGAN